MLLPLPVIIVIVFIFDLVKFGTIYPRGFVIKLKGGLLQAQMIIFQYF
jgi:hypothetical protein